MPTGSSRLLLLPLLVLLMVLLLMVRLLPRQKVVQ
jgi:hypothetical protein